MKDALVISLPLKRLSINLHSEQWLYPNLSSLIFLQEARKMALTLSNAFLQKNLSPPSLSLNAKVKEMYNKKKKEPFLQLSFTYLFFSLIFWNFQVKGVLGSNQMRWSCRKKDLHPQFYEDAKVYCNGELVMTTGGTKKEYVVDVWSGNHPFYLGSRSQLLVDADQVAKFRKKFSGLDQIMEIPVLKGEIVLPPKRKSGKGKKK